MDMICKFNTLLNDFKNINVCIFGNNVKDPVHISCNNKHYCNLNWINQNQGMLYNYHQLQQYIDNSFIIYNTKNHFF